MFLAQIIALHLGFGGVSPPQESIPVKCPGRFPDWIPKSKAPEERDPTATKRRIQTLYEN